MWLTSPIGSQQINDINNRPLQKGLHRYELLYGCNSNSLGMLPPNHSKLSRQVPDHHENREKDVISCMSSHDTDLFLAACGKSRQCQLGRLTLDSGNARAECSGPRHIGNSAGWTRRPLRDARRGTTFGNLPIITKIIFGSSAANYLLYVRGQSIIV
jgi:hypothetical protein